MSIDASYTFSNNIRDSQFKQGDVTDGMTNDEAKNFTGHIFGPENYKDPKNNEPNHILSLFIICTIILLKIILIPHIANRKAD